MVCLAAPTPPLERVTSDALMMIGEDYNMKTEKWICDACDGEILRPEQGQIEWLVRADGDRQVGRGLRMVHVKTCSPQAVDDWGCQYCLEDEYKRDGSGIYGSAISDYLGPEGLMRLLELLSRGVLPVADVVEMIKRLHVDGYEQARFKTQENC